MVLNPTPLPNSGKVKRLGDLKSELGPNISQIRRNEGEAANYGIYFDDSEYDYMQHMRDLGLGSGDSCFIDAPTPKGMGRGKQSLEGGLRNFSLQDGAEALLGGDILPSRNLRKVTYQAQQEVPDALAGFQPDMDPRLREVLEALEDEAYVDDDEDVFAELAKDGEEIDEEDFEQTSWDDEDTGWESDNTAKPVREYKEFQIPSADIAHDNEEDDGGGGWMADFSKFKKDQKSRIHSVGLANSDLQSSGFTTATKGGRKKKRKGALTNPSNYSMTSSSLFRTEGLATLDAKFDKIEERYNESLDDEASVSAASISSSVQGPVRSDFDSIMDDFLGGYSMSGKKYVKEGRYQSGLEQLDEIRRGLGPARIRTQKA